VIVDKNLYEKLNYADYLLPVIYHLDTLEQVPGRTTLNPHWHDSIEILYFISGIAEVKCDYSDYKAGPGDVVIANANQLHTVNLISQKCVYHCFILSESLFGPGEDFQKYCFENIMYKDKKLNEFLDKIIFEINGGAKEYKLAAKGLIYSLFAYLSRNYASKDDNAGVNTKKLDAIKSSIDYMENNYDKPITLEDICTSSNLSKYYFCRIFKEALGKSPIQYLNYLRTIKAMRLLAEGSYNVTEVSQKCGFSNYNYFSKVFKQNLKILPSKIKNAEKQ
jgi:AraC-like DNA-binding protein